ncbi:MAG: DUF3021 domain-containing protein [Lachnospiraceae bacterium]|nr:DUF3021 domain-containing protein [Lachnospiraceae bacterium]
MKRILSLERIRVLFVETLVITTGMLFGIGVEGIIFRLIGKSFVLSWYQPMAIFLTAFVSSIVSVVVFADEPKTRGRAITRMALHFILLFLVISLAGYVFDWFSSVGMYIGMALIYCFVYIFSWVSNMYILKKDAQEINEALKDIRDDE